jgi:hypothetical protein
MFTTGQVRVLQSKRTLRVTTLPISNVTVEKLTEAIHTAAGNTPIMFRLKSIEVQLPVDQTSLATFTGAGRRYELRSYSLSNRNVV